MFFADLQWFDLSASCSDVSAYCCRYTLTSLLEAFGSLIAGPSVKLLFRLRTVSLKPNKLFKDMRDFYVNNWRSKFNVVRQWESTAILHRGYLKVPPCRQTRTDSSWSGRSSGPTSRRRLTTSPRSSLAVLRPAGWTGSACATGSMKPASRPRTDTSRQIAGRWCPARRASSPGGRRLSRSRPALPALCGRGASPCGRRAPCTSWTLLRSPRNCCRPDNICIPPCVPSDNLKSRENKVLYHICLRRSFNVRV